MADMDQVRSLVEETIARYCAPRAQVEQIEPAALAQHEQGWSGAELRRYKVSLQQGEPITLLTKTMPLKERRVLHHLSQQGHAHTPFAFTGDLTTEAPVLTCLQDLGSTSVGIPIAEDVAPPSAQLDRQVADALAAIHVRHRGQRAQLAWLPCADAAYVAGFLIKDVWRGNWEDALATNVAFAHEFARYTPQLERAADQFAQTIQALWQEGDSLTLTHGEVHGEHVMLYQNRPYLIDWGWTYYGPLYLDLPAYFTPQTVHHYRRALAEQGVEIAEADFMERFYAIGRYVGFKYLCSGLWLWPPGPTAATGQRILLTIQWAITGAWPDRAFAVSPAAWRKLLADHERFLSTAPSESGLSGL